jgi:FdhD protein
MSSDEEHRLAKDPQSITSVVAHSEPVSYIQYCDDTPATANKPIILETAWPLVVNDQHWLTVLCTPSKLNYLVLGFLYNEALISSLDDVLDIRIEQLTTHEPQGEAVIRVELQNRELRLPERRTLTSGCGGGITFVDLAAARDPVESSLCVTPSRVADLMSKLMASVADDYQSVGGFHSAALSDGRQLLAVTADIGRHNTLDKLAGECLTRAIPMHDTILLTTGRISVEMLGKAARMQVPVVATLNSPTHLAVELAREWHITLVGYARGTKMHVYTEWQRIQADPTSEEDTPDARSP